MRAERRSKKLGAGIEFADHRQYSAGDDIRYLDWNVYGRMGRLLLRLFEEEEDLSIYLLVDCSKSMAIGTPSKLDHARRIVAALAYLGLANLDRVSIVPFADELRPRMEPARGKGRIFKTLEFLRAVEPGGPTRIGPCLTRFVHQAKRRGLAVVISDFYDPVGWEEGLNALRHHGHETYAIQVYDEREANPALHGDLTLVDCETGETRDVTISRSLLASYREEYARYCAELEKFCASKGVPCFRAPTDLAFDELVLRVFRAGGFLA
ncbi:MAG: DUF58 domain-containing protein [Myxococcales bacterium]|nr:DUF58 domain-containing protein [Myxococcales bacterium]